MKSTRLFLIALVAVSALGVLAHAQESSSVPTPASQLDRTHLPPEMRVVADTLAGKWSITWIGADGRVIGEGEELWKLAPGGSALIEENRSKVHGASAEDYAAIWWNNKTQSIRGIWCDPTINDEGCSGFTVTVEGKDVVLAGEWEYQGKRQAWREVFSRSGSKMTQVLHVGDPGKDLKPVSTIRGTVGDDGNDRITDTEELTNLATDAGTAYAARDLDRLKRLTADDYVQTDVRGGVLNKEQWLAFVRDRHSELMVETDDVRIQFYGETAIVSGHWKYTRKEDGGISDSRWTSVWTRSSEGWKRHAFQNTYVNANADRCSTEAAR